MVVEFLVPFIILALLGGTVALVIGSGRRRGSGGVDARGVRRFFQYLLLFILSVVTAVGLTELLGRLLGTSADGTANGSYLLARALAFVIIGLPLGVAVVWWMWRRQRVDPSEARSPLLTIYLTVMTLTALVLTVVAISNLVADAIGWSRFDAAAAGQLLAWGGLWFVHWQATRRLLDGTRGDVQLLGGSLAGLVWGVWGLTATLATALDLLMRPGFLLNPGRSLAPGFGILVAGSLVWVWYWLTSMRRRPGSIAWLVYLLLAGVGGGLIMSLVAASRMLWSVLVWFIGDRLGQTASEHFDSMPRQIAAVVVGVLVWWYHRAILGQTTDRNEVTRVYEYLVSGIALIGAAWGVGTVVAGFIEAFTPGSDTGMTTQNTLLAAATLLLVGVPVWWIHWRRIRSAVAADPVTEVGSVTRRIYLVALFGIAGLTAVIALLTAGFLFFQDLVDAQLGPATIRSMRYAVGVLVASAAVSAYHGTIFAQDRAVVLPVGPSEPRSVVLVGAADPDLARTVHRATGARVEIWERLDRSSQAWEESSVLKAVDGHAGQDLLVINEDQGLQVVVVGR